jgi:starvation-inducible DNA-binding protein
MSNTSKYMGLKPENINKITDQLNILLANISVFYQNVHGYHWNIQGNQFFLLHPKFGELYEYLLEKKDDVAERILTLGNSPVHSYEEFLNLSEVAVKKNISDPNKAIQEIVIDLSILLKKEKEIADLAADLNDDGTNDFMVELMRDQQKMAWMYSAHLG